MNLTLEQLGQLVYSQYKTREPSVVGVGLSEQQKLSQIDFASLQKVLSMSPSQLNYYYLAIIVVLDVKEVLLPLHGIF